MPYIYIALAPAAWLHIWWVALIFLTMCDIATSHHRKLLFSKVVPLKKLLLHVWCFSSVPNILWCEGYKVWWRHDACLFLLQTVCRRLRYKSRRSEACPWVPRGGGEERLEGCKGHSHVTLESFHYRQPQASGLCKGISCCRPTALHFRAYCWRNLYH